MSFPEQPFGFVAGRWVRSIGDTADDADRAPDYVPVENAEVVFTPQVTHRVAPDNSGWAGIIKERIPASLGERGQLIDAEGHDHLALALGVYLVEYDFGSGRSWPRHYIEVKPEHTVDNPLWLPPIAPPPEGPRIENRVVTIPADGEDGQVLVWDGGGFSWEDVPTGPPGEVTEEAIMPFLIPFSNQLQNNIMRVSERVPYVDTSFGYRVFSAISNEPDTMIYGDTGWYDITSLCEGVESGEVYIRRTTWGVHWKLDWVVLAPGTEPLAIVSDLPNGWGSAGEIITSVAVPNSEGTVHLQNIMVGGGSLFWVYETSILDGGTTTTRPEEPISGRITVPADSRFWPDSPIGEYAGRGMA